MRSFRGWRTIYLVNEANKKSTTPFEPLGKLLRRLRVSRQESLAEVSGAVEIDIDTLNDFESGSTRPNEDILMLLISHFDIKEGEAEKLWDLAGYDKTVQSAAVADATNQMVMVTPEDLKIVYTDMVHVAVNRYGVIMNFMQGTGGQPLAIARVGMSREHAQNVLEILQKSLQSPQPKELPAPRKNKKKNG